MSRTTSRKLAELDQLASDAQELVRMRLQLAIEVLGDTDWIATNFAGVLEKAEEYLQSRYFADICSFISLPVLIDIFKSVPEDKWVEYRGDLRALKILYEEGEVEEAARRKSVSWKQKCAELDEQLKQALAEVAQLRQVNEDLRNRLVNLDNNNDALKEECATLKGRLSELERLTSKMVVAS